VADKDAAEPTDESADAAATPSDGASGPEAANGGTSDPTPPTTTGAAVAADPLTTDEQSGRDRELVEVGAPAKPRAGATASKPKSADRAGQTGRKKDKATAKRDGKAPAATRTGPVTFVRESVGELRKVVYPTGQQLLNYFVVVLVFVLFVIAIVSLLDLAFGAAILKIFG
jgi:preprotein translocase subunit SecE